MFDIITSHSFRIFNEWHVLSDLPLRDTKGVSFGEKLVFSVMNSLS